MKDIMADKVLNALEVSEHKDNDGWVTSYYLCIDAEIARSTALSACMRLLTANEPKIEKKQETVKNVMRISWRVKP